MKVTNKLNRITQTLLTPNNQLGLASIEEADQTISPETQK